MIELTEEYLESQGISPAALSRFWVSVSKTDACWIWTGCVGNHGYGVLNFTVSKSRNQWLSHRFSYTVNIGPIPEALCVLHRCDNRRCVRPDHFFLGDRPANVADMVSKNRHKPCPLKGEEVYCAKLTDEKVIRIRQLLSLGYRIIDLASAFSVWPGTIGAIRSGKTWKHLL